jgi:beta-lactamase regulating signal transducer with metallopeptidase domain
MSFDQLRYMLHTNGFQIVSIRTNRVKTVSWVYGVLIPLTYVMTIRAISREEKDAEQRERNREILRQLFSRAVLFGESLIVKARKIPQNMLVKRET